MRHVEIDRRQFGRLTVGLAFVGSTLPFQIAIADDLSHWLLEKVTPDGQRRADAIVGTVSSATFDRLWWTFERIADIWELSSFLTMDKSDLENMVALKSEERPSYLAEYDAGAAVIDRAIDSMADRNKALDLLISGRFPETYLLNSRLGQFRTYVVWEFMSLAVSQGGFKRFGYENYRGFMAGSFTDRDDLPYRATKP